MGRVRNKDNEAGQSKKLSFVEALVNIIAGFFLSLLVQIIVFPFFDIQIDMFGHIYITVIFLLVSLARSYLIRRLFNGIR